jgi:hypothetical protein
MSVLPIFCIVATLYPIGCAAQDTHDQESGTPSGHNTKDRKNRHPVTSKLLITTTTMYFKSTIDKVHNAVDSLQKMCCLKMALWGQNM